VAEIDWLGVGVWLTEGVSEREAVRVCVMEGKTAQETERRKVVGRRKKSMHLPSLPLLTDLGAAGAQAAVVLLVRDACARRRLRADGEESIGAEGGPRRVAAVEMKGS